MTGFALVVYGIAGIFAVSALAPRAMWRVTRSWQYRHPAVHEPSDAAYLVMRMLFALLAVILAVQATRLLEDAREAEVDDCRHVMAVMAQRAVILGIDGMDERIARDTFERGPEPRGVELVERGDSYEIVRDGVVLGTIDAAGTAHPRCDELS